MMRQCFENQLTPTSRPGTETGTCFRVGQFQLSSGLTAGAAQTSIYIPVEHRLVYLLLPRT